MASRRLRVVVSDLEAFVERLIRKVTLDIAANLRRAPSEGGTPVDTGWARANWVVRVGQPFDQTAGTRQEAEDGNIDVGPQQAGELEAATYQLGRGTLHITNNVPYIVNLNEGSSQQAPAGFVQAAISKAVTVDILR